MSLAVTFTVISYHGARRNVNKVLTMTVNLDFNMGLVGLAAYVLAIAGAVALNGGVTDPALEK